MHKRNSDNLDFDHREFAKLRAIHPQAGPRHAQVPLHAVSPSHAYLCMELTKRYDGACISVAKVSLPPSWTPVSCQLHR